MARTSNITFGQVAQIADTLKAAGTRPTARAIRERIGSGSMGTIHKLLQQWAGKASADTEDDDAPELRSSIASALMDFVSTQIAEACEPLNDELKAAKEEAEALANENERLENIIDRLQNERDEAQRNQAISASLHRKEMEALKACDIERDNLRTRNNELHREADRLERIIESDRKEIEELREVKRNAESIAAQLSELVTLRAVTQAKLTAAEENMTDLRNRLAASEAKEKTHHIESMEANRHYQACAARLEAAAREIESLKAKSAKPVKLAAPKPKATAKASGNANS